ncbi:MAG: sulfatase-like hydrolase/transferase [Rhodothermales bacterium]
MLGCGPADPIADDRGGNYPVIDLGFQPNIVWIVAEDMSPNITVFGDSTIETPNLSRLAAEGVAYTNVYSVSGVCAPSRFSLATGIYTTRGNAQHMRTNSGPAYHALMDVPPYEALPPPEVKMMSEVLRQSGYYATNNSKQDYQFVPPVTAWDESSRQAHWENRAPGQPFFAIFNIGTTHESQIWARMGDSLWVDPDLDVPVPPYLPDNEVGQRDVRQMYSNIRQMDHQLGQRLAELEEAGLLDSTIVVWYTDHGGPLPRQKRLLYDSGLNVPMIIRFPGQVAAGTTDDQLISFVDFAPTAFSLAGIQPPAYLDGQAFLGPYDAAPRDYVHAASDRFDTVTDMIRGVRDHRYKYLRNYRTDQPYYLPVTYREQMPIMQELLRMRDAGELNAIQAQWFRPTKAPEELFDTEADPYELTNLADDPALADKLAELSAEMDRWMAETGEPGDMLEVEFLERLWPGLQQPVTSPLNARIDGETAVLTTATDGASIGYQLVTPGAEPTQHHWHLYTEPVAIPEGMELVAVAHRIGFKPSEPVRLARS